MSDDAKRWQQAVEAAAGGEAKGDPWAAFARRILEARRRGRDDRAPTRVLRRAQAIWQDSRKPKAARWLKVIADSFVDPMPALRGARGARLLRLEAGPLTLDVRVDPRPDGGTHLHVALVPASAGQVRALVAPAKRASRVQLDAHGTGTLDLAADAREIVLLVVADGEEIARTPRIPLRR